MPPKREALEQEFFNQRPGRWIDPLRVGNELPPTAQALIILFAVVGVTVLLAVR
jgi:hypothetical protein